MPKILHVVVGYRLTAYFLNAVRSVRVVSPDDHVLVIDNASPEPELHAELKRIAEADDLIEVIFRTENDVRSNRKVGSLYAAYEIAFSHAIAKGFDLLHLIQGDYQTLWWDIELVAKSMEIFDLHPRCVNIQMQTYSRDLLLTDDLDTSVADGIFRLRKYGLTDTGLYHLGRWQAADMHFGPTEQEHAKRYLGDGFEVLCHPWPTDAPIPWPAVIRNGVQRGREVVTGKPFLVKPMSGEQIAWIKAGTDKAWREDLCIPWGWACATPMWTTDLDSIDYWVMRYRDARKNGIWHLFPRLERRGIDPGARGYPHRPSAFWLFVACPARYAGQRLSQLWR
jgi:hypothetical protein